jgi:ubiquitin-protein ligase
MDFVIHMRLSRLLSSRSALGDAVQVRSVHALQSPANAEAARLFTADRREYNRRVKRVAARSIEDAWS